MGFPRQEYWNGLLPFPSPVGIPNPGIELVLDIPNTSLLCLLYWLVDSLSLCHLASPPTSVELLKRPILRESV